MSFKQIFVSLLFWVGEIMFEDIFLGILKKFGWNAESIVDQLFQGKILWRIIIYLGLALIIEFVFDPFKHRAVKATFLFKPYTPINKVGLYIENNNAKIINNCSAQLTYIIEKNSPYKLVLNTDLMWVEDNQYKMDLLPNKPTILLIAKDELHSKYAILFTHEEIQIKTNQEYQIGIKFFGQISEKLIQSKEYKFKLIMVGDGVFDIERI